MRSLLGTVIWALGYFLSSLYVCPAIPSWPKEFLSAVILMGIPLCVICCFSLAAFNICSLCLIFVNLINMSRGVSPWVYPIWNSLCFLDLGDYFLPHFREVFNYYLLKYFFMVFLFVVFFWDSYDSNVEAFNTVPEVSEIILVSFNSFFFFPL